jgi:hypothetical protein
VENLIPEAGTIDEDVLVSNRMGDSGWEVSERVSEEVAVIFGWQW